MEQSLIQSLTPKQIQQLKESLTDEETAALLYDWSKWARPKQIAPTGDWDGWLILAGRGFGKTRTGAEFVRDAVQSGNAKRIALIAETAKDGRDVIVEGESGILSCCPPWDMPEYEPSKKRLTWKNGAQAFLYDAREPGQLRGPQHDLAWMDELAKYRYAQELFDQMLFGLRLGKHPRWIATTTPRPIKLIKDLMKDPRVHITTATTHENLSNLAASYRKNVIERYANTRLGRQELNAEILGDIPGALWRQQNIDEFRIIKAPLLRRIVVAIDPATTNDENSNETGIIIGGIDNKNEAYILDDYTIKGTPEQWARKAISGYRLYQADRIVAESNQGGLMVESVMRSIDPYIPISLVRATRGKYIRAEPISALYDQGRVHHVGIFPDLEDQMIAFTSDSIINNKNKNVSPDRVDALVWLLTELFNDIITPHVIEEEEDNYNDYRTRNKATGY